MRNSNMPVATTFAGARGRGATLFATGFASRGAGTTGTSATGTTAGGAFSTGFSATASGDGTGAVAGGPTFFTSTTGGTRATAGASPPATRSGEGDGFTGSIRSVVGGRVASGFFVRGSGGGTTAMGCSPRRDTSATPPTPSTAAPTSAARSPADA